VMSNSTIGTGQLIAHAIGRRCKRIVLGLGGSATMDCGMGIAHALGVVFTGEAGVRLSPIASSLRKVEYISRDNLRPEVPRTEMLLLTDVSNALLGEDGAMQYAAQKGLKEADRPKLDAALHHFANLMEALYGTNCKLPGMGAAGGAALCCVGLLGAKMAPGAAFVLEALQAPVAIADADVILTGEGHLDAQSLRGKAAVSLARLAQVQGKPVAAICGQVSLGDTELRSAGIDLAMSLYATGVDLDSIRAATYRALVLKTREMMEEMSVKLLS
jgi:glycerate 2-kinase